MIGLGEGSFSHQRDINLQNPTILVKKFSQINNTDRLHCGYCFHYDALSPASAKRLPQLMSHAFDEYYFSKKPRWETSLKLKDLCLSRIPPQREGSVHLSGWWCFWSTPSHTHTCTHTHTHTHNGRPTMVSGGWCDAWGFFSTDKHWMPFLWLC